MGRLVIVPMSLREANAFVLRHHRHSGPVRGHLVSVGAVVDDVVVGVAILGRPLARALQDGWTAEVTRVCTDGTRNACSFLYGRIRRVALAMGYRKLVTYTRPEESGASLRAAGFRLIQTDAGGGSWSSPGRPRVDTDNQQRKFRWETGA